MRKTHRHFIRLALIAFSVVFARASILEAGSASASATGWSWAARPASADTGTNNFRWSTPTAANTIKWTSGENWTDGFSWSQRTYGPELKFALAPVRGRIFTGFSRTNGPSLHCGSSATTSGTGSSTVGRTFTGGIRYLSSWTVNAGGALGTIPRVPVGTCSGYRGYDAQATGKDPVTINAAQLADAGVTGPVDLMFGGGLTGGSWSRVSTDDYVESGGIGLDVSFETAAGSWRLLSIRAGASGVSVQGAAADFPADVLYYTADDPDADPATLRDNPVSLEDLQSLLDSSVSNNSLSRPIYVVIVLHNVQIPDESIDGDTLVAIHVDSSAAQHGEEIQRIPPE